MKTFYLTVLLLLFYSSIFSQIKFDPTKTVDPNVVYQLNGYTRVYASTSLGDTIYSEFSQKPPQGILFKVIREVYDSAHNIKGYVIKFNDYKTGDNENQEKIYKFNKYQQQQQEQQNTNNIPRPQQRQLTQDTAAAVVNNAQDNDVNSHISGLDQLYQTITAAPIIVDTNPNITADEQRFFYISKDEILKYGVVYDPYSNWHFALGSIIYFSRLRPRTHEIAGRWSTDLSLGLAAGIRRDLNKNFALTALGGFAISKITLDSYNVRTPVLTSSIDKPAFTPNLNLLLTYKIFSIGIGAGMDWINKDTPEAKGWIYNNKLFWALSFGINVFSDSSSGTTPTNENQKTP